MDTVIAYQYGEWQLSCTPGEYQVEGQPRLSSP